MSQLMKLRKTLISAPNIETYTRLLFGKIELSLVVTCINRLTGLSLKLQIICDNVLQPRAASNNHFNQAARSIMR